MSQRATTIGGVLISVGAVALGVPACSDDQSVGGTPATTSTDGTGGAGGSGGAYSGPCPAYQVLCDGACVPTQDPGNCGACGTTCTAPQVCSAGKCADGCLTDLVACGGACVSLTTDAMHCGGCDSPCDAGQGCVDGQCQPAVPVGPPPDKCNDGDGGPPITWPGTELCSGNVAQTTFVWALCSCSDVSFGSQMVADAYDSLSGPYEAPGLPGAGLGFNGGFASNGAVSVSGSFWSSTDALVTTNDVDVLQQLHRGGALGVAGQFRVGLDAFIAGDVTANGQLAVQGTLFQPATATNTGTVTYGSLVAQDVTVPPPCPCDAQKLLPIAAVVAAAATTNDNALIGLDPNVFANGGGEYQHLDLPCGNYYLSQIAMAGNPVSITAHGKTALFIGGDVDADSLGFVVDPKGELDVLIAGNVHAAGNSTFGSPNYPALSRTYIAGANLLLEGNTTIGGYIYAPSVTLVVNSPFNMYGGLFIGSYADPMSETYIHYDHAVLEVGDDECPPPPLQCGDCSDCGNQACIDGECGDCTSDAQCCAPLLCQNGSCVPVPN